MKRIALIDPSVGTRNIGDEIIHEAVVNQIERVLPNSFYVRVSSHEFMLWDSRKILAESDYIFVGGSNLLKSKMEWNTQWKLSPWDFFSLRNVILLGCGWRHYGSPPTRYTSNLYRRILNKNVSHSVRDQLTANQLSLAGIDNVINTSCVTMWDLSPVHCSKIPVRKSTDVVITLTAYDADHACDERLIQLAKKHYSEVYLFVQQPEDLKYAQGLAGGSLKPIAPNLKAYDALLDSNIDYLGTRLHGGIRALQRGRRTLIVAIDNRATEIARDTGLPTAARKDVAHIEEWIVGSYPTSVHLPEAAIQQWRAQFCGS
jgi:polysaccharide pyruvyl transferase WcaK-like protein